MSEDVRVFSYNLVTNNDQDITTQDASKLVKLVADEMYDIVCFQSIFREQIHKLIVQELLAYNYKFLTRGSIEKTGKPETTIFIPGCFFATTLPILKWEFEHFDSSMDGPRFNKQPPAVKGLLSVLLDLKGQHFWVFSPQFQDRRSTRVLTKNSSLVHSFLYKTVKIMHSKLWTNEKQPQSIAHCELTYGSYIELHCGSKSAVYDRNDMNLGVGLRVRDRIQRFKVLSLTQTTPAKPVCYGEPLLFQTFRGLFPHASDSWNYIVSPDVKGQRSVLTIVDPRYIKSTAVIKNNDQFALRDYEGTYIGISSGNLVGGKSLEEAALFKLDIYAVVPLPGADLDCQVVTTGSRVSFEEVKEKNNVPHYLSVEPNVNLRWHTHCESLMMGDLETFEIINPDNFLGVTPLCDNDRVYMRSSTGHFLTVDPKNGWLFGDSKRIDVDAWFSLAKDLRIRNDRKKRKKRDSLSRPFNVEHTVGLDSKSLVWHLSSTPIEQIFTLQEELGRGSYGVVYRARHVDGFNLAIKVLKATSINDDIQNEIEILKMCTHQNIVSYFGTVKKEDSLWILMDYMELGSIRDMIDGKKSPLTEPEIAFVCAYTLKGLNYLHSRGIIHRDVKAANILLSNRAEIKIADFGVSNYFAKISQNETAGTPLFLAPEVLRRKPTTQACDIWSLGITLIEMGDGHPPNHNVPVLRAMRQIVSDSIPSPTFSDPTKWSSNIKDFVSQCLQKDHMKRPSAYHLLSHPFLEGVLKNKSLQELMLMTSLLVRKISRQVFDTEALKRAIASTSAATNNNDNNNPPASPSSQLSPGKGKKQSRSDKETIFGRKRANSENQSMLRFVVKSPFTQKKKPAPSTQNPSTNTRNIPPPPPPPLSPNSETNSRGDRALKKKLVKRQLSPRGSANNSGNDIIYPTRKNRSVEKTPTKFSTSNSNLGGNDSDATSFSGGSPTNPIVAGSHSQQALVLSESHQQKENMDKTRDGDKPSMASSAPAKRNSSNLSGAVAISSTAPSLLKPLKSKIERGRAQVRFENETSEDSSSSTVASTHTTSQPISIPSNKKITLKSERSKEELEDLKDSVNSKKLPPLPTMISNSILTVSSSGKKDENNSSKDKKNSPRKKLFLIDKTPAKPDKLERTEDEMSEKSSSNTGHRSPSPKRKPDSKNPSPRAKIEFKSSSPQPESKFTELKESRSSTSPRAKDTKSISPRSKNNEVRSTSPRSTRIELKTSSPRTKNESKSTTSPRSSKNELKSTSPRKIADIINPSTVSKKREATTDSSSSISQRKKERRGSEPNSNKRVTFVPTVNERRNKFDAETQSESVENKKSMSEFEFDDEGDRRMSDRMKEKKHPMIRRNSEPIPKGIITRSNMKSDLKNFKKTLPTVDGSGSGRRESLLDVVDYGGGPDTDINTTVGIMMARSKTSVDFQQSNLDDSRTEMSYSNTQVEEPYDPACDTSFVFGFGGNLRNQLGLVSLYNIFSTPRGIPKFQKEIQSIVCGGYHSFILQDEKLYCFGDNSHGQLGLGDFSGQDTPIVNKFFKYLKVSILAAGLHHTILKTQDGRLWGFGNNRAGELGIINYFPQPVPQHISFFNDTENVVSISCGTNHTLIVTSDGALYAFGSNSYGQLGLGPSKEDFAVPQCVEFLSDKKVVKVATKGYFSLAITDEGQLYSFGENSYGQLGLGHKENQTLPQLVASLSGKRVIDASAGMFHSIVLTDDGHVYSFGNNRGGQLGLGTTDGHTLPEQISFFANKKVLKASCGLHYTMVITDDNQVFGFGYNSSGQLGLGNTHMQPTPQLLLFFQDKKVFELDCGHVSTLVGITSKATISASQKRFRPSGQKKQQLDSSNEDKSKAKSEPTSPKLASSPPKSSPPHTPHPRPQVSSHVPTPAPIVNQYLESPRFKVDLSNSHPGENQANNPFAGSPNSAAGTIINNTLSMSGGTGTTVIHSAPTLSTKLSNRTIENSFNHTGTTVIKDLSVNGMDTTVINNDELDGMSTTIINNDSNGYGTTVVHHHNDKESDTINLSSTGTTVINLPSTGTTVIDNDYVDLDDNTPPSSYGTTVIHHSEEEIKGTGTTVIHNLDIDSKSGYDTTTASTTIVNNELNDAKSGYGTTVIHHHHHHHHEDDTKSTAYGTTVINHYDEEDRIYSDEDSDASSSNHHHNNNHTNTRKPVVGLRYKSNPGRSHSEGELESIRKKIVNVDRRKFTQGTTIIRLEDNMSSDFDEEDEEPSSSNTATTVNHHYDESDDDYSTSDVSEDDDGESDEERFNGGLETTQYNFDETESSEDHNITDGMGTSVVRTDIEDDTDQSEDDSVNTTSSPDLAQPNNSFLSGANANSTTIIRDMDEPVTNGTTVVIHDNHNEDNAQDHQLVRSNGRQSLVVSDKNSTTGETPRKNMSSRHASEGVLLIDQKLRRESQGQSTVFRSESSPTLRKNRSKLNVDHSRLDSSRSEPSRPELSRLDSSRPETSRMDSTRSEPTSRLDSSRVDSSRLDSSRIVETSRLDSSRTDSSRFDSRDTSRLEKSQRNKQSKDEEEDVSPFLVVSIINHNTS
eukprot:TRINITY_DN1574_c0_g1_i3.p1 TRINITY_DN1574_c0_g1~~TRINITY_DN1574_c0_g1_i3.p1  ORF type:complete len:2540 (-),score=589.38 TRINITY_DN1574_c0_g1_i3:112-7731(-)